MKPKKQLEKARAAHAAGLTQIADKEAARNAALLAGAEAAAIATIDADIATLQHAARTESDRIELLKVEVEKEEGLQRAKRRAEHIARVKAKIAEADAVGIEAQAVAATQILALDAPLNVCFRAIADKLRFWPAMVCSLMTQLESRVRVAAIETMFFFAVGLEQSVSLPRACDTRCFRSFALI
jgi:hypothetical protein